MPVDTIEISGSLEVWLKNHHTGEVYAHDTYSNLAGDIGDGYLAAKVAAGLSPALLGQPAFINGMKLGTGTTSPVTKSGAAANLGVGLYIATSNKSLDSNAFAGGPWPKLINLGAGNGWQVEYQCTYLAASSGGTVTNAAISEVIKVTDAGSDAASASSQVVARALIGPYNKAADADLVVVWRDLFKGI